MALTTDYPLQLGLAYTYFVGYLARTIFVAMKLPASVGVMFSGFAFSFFFQEDLEGARDYLQELSFFLVLLTAGLDISLIDLKPYIFVLAGIPPAVEMIGIASYAVYMLEFTWLEGFVLGTTLFSVGDGLVIPKLKEFQEAFPTHPLPHTVFICVPLEASFALVTFGILHGFAAPSDDPVDLKLLVGASALRIAATVIVAGILGYCSAKLVDRRMSLELCDNKVFTGKSVEAFLMLICVTLFAYALGAGEDGHYLVPVGLASGSLFNPELMVIITGAFFSDFVSPKTLHKCEGVLGGVWVFGQITLFTMLGSKTKASIFPKVTDILPIIVVGLAARMVGVCIAMLLTMRGRPPADGDIDQKWSSLGLHIMFVFLSCLPRATIQGALGQIPLADKFFQGSPRWRFIEGFIGTASKLYIVLLAVFGMILLNTFGPKILRMDLDRNMYDSDRESEEEEEEVPSPRHAALKDLADELNVKKDLLDEKILALGLDLQLQPSSPRYEKIRSGGQAGTLSRKTFGEKGQTYTLHQLG